MFAKQINHTILYLYFAVDSDIYVHTYFQICFMKLKKLILALSSHQN